MDQPAVYVLPVLTILIIFGSLCLSGCISYEQNSIPSDTQSSQTKMNETIKIGAIYNLEGSEATFDLPSIQGANLAVKAINEQGGINGIPLELVLENGKSDTSAVNAGVTKLVESGSIPIIIGLSNPDHTLPAAKVAASHQVYFVTSGATSPQLPLQVPDYLYLACMGDNTQAAVSAQYAIDHLDAKNAYILYQSDLQYPTLLAGYFKAGFEELNGTVQKTDTFVSGDTNFSAHITNVSELYPIPDLIFVSAQTWNDAKPVIQAIRNAGITLPIMGGDGYDSPALLTGGAEGIDNVYYTTHTWFNSSHMSGKQHDFMVRYLQEYNEPAVPFSGLGYDTMMIVAEAIRNAGSPINFPDGMTHIILYSGVTGNLSYTGNSHIPKKSVSLMKILNGTLVHIDDIIPVNVPLP